MSLRVHEGGAVDAAQGALASDIVLVHDGTGAIDGVVSEEISEPRSRRVTFAEPGKGYQTDSSTGSLSLSDSSSDGEVASSGVTTSQGLSDSTTTVMVQVLLHLSQ